MKTPSVSCVAFMLLTLFLLVSCVDGTKKESESEFVHPQVLREKPSRSPSKGIGPIKEIELADSLDPEKVKKGKLLFQMKCASCHKLTDQRLVGPGWEGITNTRQPEWIMNMITNTEEMLEKDRLAKIQLEECVTRMPNQNVTIEEARSILEFMRQNDLDQVNKKDGALQEK
ncbi:c-type cytochrome [Formosa haliotis]|uniref:c-type cytochrome n=1 Tax=Formosa haliotis TaxID=1555194 RepID=UPI000826D1B6|nr:cytochrome c [Formosa haliotis]